MFNAEKTVKKCSAVRKMKIASILVMVVSVLLKSESVLLLSLKQFNTTV